MAFVLARAGRTTLKAFIALAVSLVCALFIETAQAQSVAEAAGATSVSATAASSTKPAAKFPATAGAAASQHLIAAAGPPPEETNVHEFQVHAGKDAGKVLLRATPVNARIWVDGKIVGKTPMLLVLAPGKYEVEMRGARGETGKSSVALLPHETRELLVKLQVKYPARVTAEQ